MNILITGASGTLGTELIRNVLSTSKNLIPEMKLFGLTRNEHHLEKIRPYATPILGDIRNLERMSEITQGMDYIFHLAALKHVDLMEKYKSECLDTNLEGTKNLIYCQKLNQINKIIFVSTDKAVKPINTYGLCKALSEKLILENPSNAVCRYGNVFGSKGSIFEKLPKILAETNTINITHPEMTRFWIKINDAAKFVASCMNVHRVGVQIPPMKGSNVLRMFEICAELTGNINTKINIVGLRPGEKIHEDLDENLSSNTCDQFTDDELKELLSESFTNGIRRKYGEALQSHSQLS